MVRLVLVLGGNELRHGDLLIADVVWPSEQNTVDIVVILQRNEQMLCRELAAIGTS